jgi:hypothetical protein
MAGSKREVHAKLRIPSTAGEATALKWRITLIQKHEFFPDAKLKVLLNSMLGATWPINAILPEQQEFLKLALSEKSALDELDEALMYCATELSKPGQIDKSKRHYETLAALAEMLTHEISRIRAKLAIQEVAAHFDPDMIVPKLVQLTPDYLGGSMARDWMRRQQYNARYTKTQNRAKAERNLKALTKAITGDRRTGKPRDYPYWLLNRTYEELANRLLALRLTVIDHKLLAAAQIHLADRLKELRVPEPFHDRVLYTKTSPKILALEIMIDSGLIRDAKAFQDFQSKLNKIRKKHFVTKTIYGWPPEKVKARKYPGPTLNLAELIFTYFGIDFLDHPRSKPDVVFLADPLKALESVTL